MANSARIQRGGKLLYLLLDPNSGTLTQPATVAGDVQDISISASGGAVTVERVAFPKKYPFVDLNTNQFKVCVKLSRRIKAQETVSATVASGMFSDGTRDSSAATSLSATNTSAYFDDGDINTLLSPSAKIIYVDPTGGDDALAAAVNSSQGYYTLAGDAATLGSDAARPVGSVQAYATLGEAENRLSSTDHGVIFFKRGETFAGASQFAVAGSMLPIKSGTGATSNIIFAAYGSGTDMATLAPSTSGTSGNRVLSAAAAMQNFVFGYGMDLQNGTACLRLSAPNADGEFGNWSFIGCKIHRIETVPSGEGDGSRLRPNVAVTKCWIDNANTESGHQGSDDWNDFTFREWAVEECVFRKCGNSSLEHPLYTKAFGDLFVNSNLFDDNSGSGVKIDSCWGVEVSENILTRQPATVNIESNGDPVAGIPSDRSEDTETNEYPVVANSDGAYSKWCSVFNNVHTDSPASGSTALVSAFGPASYSEVHSNLFVSSVDAITTAVGFSRTGGSGDGGYTRDSYGNEVFNNTFALLATTSTQQYGFSIAAPDTDTFDATNNTSKGHHNFIISRNITYFGTGITGASQALRVSADEYADAKAAGRLDGVWTANNAYRASASQTDIWGDGATDYSTPASWEAIMDSDATGQRFENPGFSDSTYQVSTWAIVEGYSDLDDYSLTLAQELVADSLDLPQTITTIANAVLTSWQPASLAAGNYGGTLPGASNWASGSPISEPYDGSSGWYISTVAPITDPADANWGRQYSGGDGSLATPFGSYKELQASGLLVDGQTIYIDQPTGIPCYGSHQIDESNITITRGGETARARWVNGYPIDVGTLVSSHATNDIYRCATGALGTSPTEVSRNWNTSTNAQGNRYGIMDETTLVGLQTTTGWFYDSGTDTLYVSIPSGDDIADYEFIVGLAGDTLRMTSPLASTVEHQSYEHALQAGNGVGYGLRLLGNTQGFTHRHNVYDGCQYHHFGAVGTGTQGITSHDNHYRTAKGGNDSQVVLYSDSGGVGINNCLFRDETFYAVPWLTPAQTPFNSGGIKAFATHSDPTAGDMAVGGMKIKNCRVFWYGDNPTSAHSFFSATAGNIRSTTPADLSTHTDYPVQIEDCVSDVMGFSIGSTSGDVHTSCIRSLFSQDQSSVTGGYFGLGRAPIALAAGNTGNGDVAANFESCVFSMTHNDIANRSIMTGQKGGTGTFFARFRNCSLRLQGSYTQKVMVFTLAGTIASDTVEIRQCEISGESNENVFESGNTLANYDITENLYTGFGSTYQQTGGTVVKTKTEYEADVDPDGSYDETLVFVDDDTLEPDAATQAIVNDYTDGGPEGINRRLYSNRWGAYQYGASTQGGGLGGGTSASVFLLLINPKTTWRY